MHEKDLTCILLQEGGCYITDSGSVDQIKFSTHVTIDAVRAANAGHNS